MVKIFTSSDLDRIKEQAKDSRDRDEKLVRQNMVFRRHFTKEWLMRALLEVIASHQALLGSHTHEDLGRVKECKICKEEM